MFSKIQCLLGRQLHAETPDNDTTNASDNERIPAPAEVGTGTPPRSTADDVRNAVIRGAAAGATRAVARKVLDEIFPG
jgi:hypothetical protein